MNENLQTWIAAGVVFLTLAAFIVRFLRRRKNPGGCGGGCGCEATRGGGLHPPSPAKKAAR